jgi:hypothetical protein
VTPHGACWTEPRQKFRCPSVSKSSLKYIPSLTAELIAILDQFHAKGYLHLRSLMLAFRRFVWISRLAHSLSRRISVLQWDLRYIVRRMHIKPPIYHKGTFTKSFHDQITLRDPFYGVHVSCARNSESVKRGRWMGHSKSLVLA